MKDSLDSHERTLLDAIPLAIFVVDEDVRIHDLNRAAATVFGLEKTIILKRRGGEVLHCLHSSDVPEGCGRGPFCQDCVIRNSVTASLRGQAVTRKRAKVELLMAGNKRDLELLITASPLPSKDRPLALLIIEDISEISTLRDLIPICANCKKIRDDRAYWQSVESYFNIYIGVSFTHGICPACMGELYPEYAEKMKKATD